MNTSVFPKLFCSVFFALLTVPVWGESQVELSTAAKVYVGRPVAHNQQYCWLESTEGRYTQVLFEEVTASRKLSAPFHPRSAIDLRSSLKTELGKSFDVVTKGSFVIAGPPSRVQLYAEVMDHMSRSFSRYTSVRRLPVTNPTFPLIVIIFEQRSAFEAYSRAEEISGGSLLQGYYHPMSNRIVLVESPSNHVTANKPATTSPRGTVASLPQQTVSTLIHEGIHQLAFNQGLHSRIGRNPRWIVEGLATMLEANSEINPLHGSQSSHVNEVRLSWFKNYRREGRQETIAEFITRDEHFFQSNMLNAYSQAWALSFFLAENYPGPYASYLKRVAQRDPMLPNYSAAERLADFQTEFGKDISWLEVRFLRYIDALESR